MEKCILNNVVQLGIVVNDVERAAAITCFLFSLDPQEVVFYDMSETPVRIKYKGKKIESYMKIAMVTVGTLELEFIQFLKGDANFHKDFYDENGPGLQHICVSTSNYKEAIREIKELGASTLIEGGNSETGYYQYLDLREQNGMIVELYDDSFETHKNNC